MPKLTYRPDPPTARVLAAIAASDAPPYSAFTPDEARAQMHRAGEVGDLAPIPVAHVSDRTIPGPGGDLKVRLYDPVPEAAGPRPLTLFFHGGGFVIGDLDTHDTIARALAHHSGAKLMAVDYRLAPEHPFPAAFDDAIAAFDWLIANAREIGADTPRLAVAGDSAGASLSIAVARHARSKDIALKAQGLLYPVCDLSKTYASEAEFARTPPISTDVLDYFWGHFLGPSRTPELLRDLRLSPMLDPDLSGLPPAFVLTAGLDPLRDEGEAFAERLIAAGIETQYFCVTGTIHGFLRMGKLIPSVEDTLKAAGTFLGRQLVSEAA